MDRTLLDAFPRSYHVDTDVELPGGSGGERVHYVRPGKWGVARDGVLLRLRPDGGSAWLAMFAGCSGASACPHPFHVLTWGPEDTYVGDVRDPSSFRCWDALPGPLLYLVPAPAARRLFGATWGRFAALGPDGPTWEREDHELYSPHRVRLEGDEFSVTAQSPSGSFWRARYDVETGAQRSREELPFEHHGEPDARFPLRPGGLG